VQAETDFEPRHLFTAPWEPVVVRRGDALGLRALADQFADALAPDLSNRVRDGRWVWGTGESWRAIDGALRDGRRGLPGGSSLARLLRTERNGMHQVVGALPASED
jgi:hypothetical protein